MFMKTCSCLSVCLSVYLCLVCLSVGQSRYGSFSCYFRFVRHSLLHAICMVMCSLPPAILLSDLQAEIIETRAWLQGSH